MLDRIEMNVIDMAFKIELVAQCVLPIASLPDSALAFAGAADGDTLPYASTRVRTPL